MKLLGITEEFTTCDCCGKTNLKCTVAFETATLGIVYYGRTCATRHSGKPTKQLNSELKAINHQAYNEAMALWRNEPTKLAYDNKLKELNCGPRISFTERWAILEPYSKAYDSKRAEIIAAISAKYMLKPNSLHLY